MLEWLIPIIVDNIFGYILDQSGLGDKVRSKFQHKPVQDAFQHSLQKTFAHFEELYPQLAAEDLFRQSFQEPSCASILAQLLLRDGEHHSNELANLWVDALYKGQPSKRAAALRKLLPIATDFLNYLDDTLRAEPALREIHDSQALERTASGIASLSNEVRILVNRYIPPQVSDEDIRKQCQQYCEQLYDQWKMLDFKGIQYADINRPVSIPLSEVFVLPDVLVGIPEYETLERGELVKGYALVTSKKERRERSQEDEQKHSLHRERRSSKEQPVVLQREDLLIALVKHQRLIILGDPGSGKSTFLRYLMLTLAENINKIGNDFPQLASDIQNMIPLYIPLSSYAESWLSHGVEERSLKDFLPKHLRYLYLDAFTNAIQWQLERGQLLILLVGLDEIPDASLRIQIVRQIEIFTQSYPQNRFVVTSRIVGYKDAPLAADYQAYTLADFNEEQIKTFTKKWCPAYERWVNQVEDSQSFQNAATKEADKLFQATHLNEGVKRLAVNPLLLTILALIQRQGIELPSHRVELFDLCVTTLLETWLRAKGQIGVTQLSKNDLIKILRPLAFWMHTNPTIGAIPEEELLEQIVRQLLERRIALYEDEAQRLAAQFLQIIHGKTGILIERGKHRYGFLHLTFEEYFAAWELVVRKRNREEFIKQYLHDPRWREVILLAVGIVGIIQSDENGVTELVEEAILNARSPFERWLHRDLLFAGLCLADDVGVSIACEDAVFEQMIYTYLTSPYDSIRTSFSKIISTWRGTATAKKAVPLVLDLINPHEKLKEGDVSLLKTPTKFPVAFQLGEKLEAYRQHLVQQNRESTIRLVQLNIVIALSHLRDMANMIEFILDALSDSDSNVRETAALALSLLGSDHSQVIEALLKALPDSNRNVREAIVRALGLLGSDHPQVIEALFKAFSDADVREAAAIGLGLAGSDHPQVIEALLKALSDSNRNVQDGAAIALCLVSSGHSQVVEALLKALTDSNKNVRESAAIGLGLTGSGHPLAVEALLKALSDAVSDVRQAAASALGLAGSGHPLAVEALLKALSDADADVRQAAASALGLAGSDHPLAVEALLKALSGVDRRAREAAAMALGLAGSDHPEVVDYLLTILSNESTAFLLQKEKIDQKNLSIEKDLEVRKLLLLCQVGSDHPQVIETLLEKISDADSSVREAVARVLGQARSDHPQVIEILLKALSDTDFNVRQAAATTLGLVGSGHPHVVEALLKALSDADRNVREAVATALSLVGSGHPQVIEALLMILSGADRNVQAAAARALGFVGNSHPQVVETLLNVLSSSAWNVREAAARALGLVGSDYSQVVEALLKTLSDDEWKVREATSKALGKVGSGHPQVVEALLKSLCDTDSDVQVASATALGQVGSDHTQVVEALLKTLCDADTDVQEASAAALAVLPIDSSVIGTSLEEILFKYELMASKQFTADHLQGSLLTSLQQMIGEI